MAPPRNWRDLFLQAFRNSANVRAACQAAGIDRTTVYKARQRSKEFAKAWQEAREDAIDALEAVAWQRARGGSDYLLWKLLESNRRSLYGNKVELRGAEDAPLKNEVTIRVVYDEDINVQEPGKPPMGSLGDPDDTSSAASGDAGRWRSHEASHLAETAH